MTTCEHCGGQRQGYGVIKGKKVCHPDVGMDCYHLVTVYGHEMPCKNCINTLTAQVTNVLLSKFAPPGLIRSLTPDSAGKLLDAYRGVADEIIEMVRKGEDSD